VLKGHELDVLDVAVNSDGTRVLTGSRDTTARVWSLSSGKELMVLRGHEAYIANGFFLGEGRQALTISNDGTARTWVVGPSAEPVRLKDPDDTILFATFNRDATLAVSAAGTTFGKSWTRVRDKTIVPRIFDTTTGKEKTVLQGHTGLVWSAAFSPDGSRIATDAQDRTVRLWMTATGAPLLVFEGRAAPLFSPDGSHLLTTDYETSVHINSLVSPTEEVVLKAHAPVTATSWHPREKIVATAARDEVARVWDASTAKELAAIDFKHSFNAVARNPYFLQSRAEHCLTQRERLDAFLDPTMPAWCVRREKWPATEIAPLAAASR
jgi:eukaryotic-like serine/threonine-protein kinase